ncbi:hypothetical protein U8335_01835 [Roseiconus lacunae]|uniref:hypothetical protein n=1 Tax=Roseiconus lacunae TaxID=2605694 RepID=UPI00308FCC54|nr:hypothetical protein U8335_01835 [Stieleria sp. HD01]
MFNFQLYRKAVATNRPLDETELRQLGPNERFFYCDLATRRGFDLPDWFVGLVADENPIATSTAGNQPRSQVAYQQRTSTKHIVAKQIFQRRSA